MLSVEESVKVFMKNWEKQKQSMKVDFSANSDDTSSRPKLKLWKPLLSSFGGRFILAIVIAVFYYLNKFSKPLVSLSDRLIHRGVACLG